MKTKINEMARILVDLSKWGISIHQGQQLLRIQRTLHRWAERECGNDRGCICRDEETGKPYWESSISGFRTPVRDGESAALRRLAGIMKAHRTLVAYHQSDPRGCALYILRKADVRPGEALDQIYTRGVAVSA